MSNVLIYGHHRDSNQLVSLQSSATGLLQVESKDQQMSDKLDEIKTAIETKTLSKLNDSVDISNQQVLVGNFPTDYTKESTLAALKVDVEDLRFDVLDLSGKINNNSTYTNAIETVVENFPSNFSLESGGNLASIKTNTDKLNNDSIHTSALQVEVKNTSVPVTGNVTVNTISGFALESGGNLASIKTNTDKLNNDSIHTGAIQVEVKNTSVPVTGNVTVNTISGFAQESGGNLATIKTNTDKLNNDSIHTSAIQVEVKNTSVPVTGSLTVNTISGFAQESGGNLASIKTNTDKLNNDSIHTSALQVEVKNTSVPVTGNVTVNTISGYALETTQVTANSKLDTIGTKITQLNDKIILDGSYLQTNVKNFPSSTNSHIQAYDPTLAGYFDVTSTGIGVNTSALDVAVKNTVGVTGSVIISNLPSTQPISGSISNNFTLDTTTQATNTKLDGIKSDLDNLTFDGTSGNLNVNVASGSLSVSSVNIKDSSGNNLNSTSNALNSYITNTSIPVTGSFYPVTQPVSGSVSSNTKSGTGQDITATDIGGKRGLDVNLITTTVPVTGSFWQAIQTVDGTVNAKIQSSSGASIGATASSLQTYDYNVNLAFDTTGEVIKTLGVAKNGASYVPISCDGSGIQNVFLQNDNTTNSYNKNGINTYSIVPTTKTYTIGGYDANGTFGNCMIVGNSSANISVSTYNFGSDNTRQYWAVFNNAASRLLYYDYVDATGNLVENASVTVTSAIATSLGTFVTLVDWRLASGFTASADALFVGLSSTITTLKSSSLYYEDINQKLVGVFTIPNGYIGNINTISSLVNSASGIQMNRWTSNGSRSAIWRINNTGNLNVSSGYNGCFGETLTAGQSVAFSSQSAVIGKSAIVSITLQKI